MAKETKSSVKKKPERKAPEKKASAAPATGPVVDPAQSAAAAAALVARKVTPVASGATGAKTESTSFKNLKESLNKPHIGGVLDKIAPSSGKKSSLPFGGGQQVGHNQTFGADVSRRNVPRRTNG